MLYRFEARLLWQVTIRNPPVLTGGYMVSHWIDSAMNQKCIKTKIPRYDQPEQPRLP